MVQELFYIDRLSYLPDPNSTKYLWHGLKIVVHKCSEWPGKKIQERRMILTTNKLKYLFTNGYSLFKVISNKALTQALVEELIPGFPNLCNVHHPLSRGKFFVYISNTKRKKSACKGLWDDVQSLKGSLNIDRNG